MNVIYEEIRIAIHAIWRRRWLALAVAWGICLAGWLVIALIPNSYESRARVLVQMQSLLSNKIGVTPNDRQRDLDRVRQSLASTVNLEKVVRGTDLARQASSDADVAAAVDTLRKTIIVKAQQDNLFEISATASAGGFSDAQNAKLAQAIVRKLIDIFVEENLAGNRDENSQTLRFLDDELARRQRELSEAEAKRVAFEQKYVGLLPGVGSIDQRMEAARVELNSIDSNLISAQSALAAMNGQMAATPASIAGVGGVGGARGRIAALEGQLADAAARGWTDQHPDVVAIRAQIARLSGQAASETPGAGGSANPAYVTLRAMQAEKQGAVAALATRKAQLQSDMAALTQRQIDEPGVAAEQARIGQDYDVLKAQYDKLLADREDVKLRSDVSAKTDAVRFSVIDPPSAPRVPVAPNRPLLLAAVLILGMGGGVAAAFAQAQLQTSYTTAPRLEAASGMTVLGAISEVVTPAHKAERRQRMMWFAGGSGGLAACFLLLMLVEFVQRGLMA